MQTTKLYSEDDINIINNFMEEIFNKNIRKSNVYVNIPSNVPSNVIVN